jgi:hypothetical protein
MVGCASRACHRERSEAIPNQVIRDHFTPNGGLRIPRIKRCDHAEKGTTMSQYKPRNPRIISIRTNKRILHIEDALTNLDRLHFDLYAYAQGNGAHTNVNAFLERHTARALAFELATGKLTYFDPFKDWGGGTTNGKTTARMFAIENTDGDTVYPVRITILNGPGHKQGAGLIVLDKKSEHTKLQLLLSYVDCRRVGLAILDHIRAWETHTYPHRAADVWQPDPDATPAPDDPDGLQPQAVDPSTGEILATSQQTAEARRGSANLKPQASDDDPILRYADGQPVNDNHTEIETYQRYVAATKQIPPSLDALREWYASSK